MPEATRQDRTLYGFENNEYLLTQAKEASGSVHYGLTAKADLNQAIALPHSIAMQRVWECLSMQELYLHGCQAAEESIPHENTHHFCSHSNCHGTAVYTTFGLVIGDDDTTADFADGLGLNEDISVFIDYYGKQLRQITDNHAPTDLPNHTVHQALDLLTMPIMVHNRFEWHSVCILQENDDDSLIIFEKLGYPADQCPFRLFQGWKDSGFFRKDACIFLGNKRL